MKTILTTAFLALCSVGFSQIPTLSTTERTQQDISISDPVERYQKDYELKNYVFNGDSTILYKLNLDHLESYRQASAKVEVEDPYTNLIVILYPRGKFLTEDN